MENLKHEDVWPTQYDEDELISYYIPTSVITFRPGFGYSDLLNSRIVLGFKTGFELTYVSSEVPGTEEQRLEDKRILSAPIKGMVGNVFRMRTRDNLSYPDVNMFGYSIHAQLGILLF